jgi:hypothetical protein
VQRAGDGRTDRVLDGRVIGRSGGVVYCLHCACGDEEHGFLVEPQKQGRRFESGLSSKPLGQFFVGLASKPVKTVSSGLASKPTATVFSSLASKLVATVSPGLASKSVVDFLVEPQNQGGGGFPGLGLKTDSFGLVIWGLKSP